jgi:putative membrane protein
MTGFFLRAAIVAIGLWIATRIFPGLVFAGPGSLIAAAILLGIVNAVIRPLAILLTLPLTLVTLGLFLLVINAAMLGLVALLVPGLKVASFWTALGSSVVVSITSWLASGLIGGNGRIDVIESKRR